MTDDWDRRTLSTLLTDFVSSRVITDNNYVFSTEGEAYGLPDRNEYRHYIQHIKVKVIHFSYHSFKVIIHDILSSENLFLEWQM
jgi:hypothetical protein